MAENKRIKDFPGRGADTRMNVNSENSVAAVVVTYNRKDLLRECIGALLQQTYGNLQIYVIDNASSDGTQDSIKDYIVGKKIFYFNTGNNIGGAGGFNYGIRKAVESGYDYIWLMDDDTIPNTDALEQLIEAALKLDFDFGFLSGFAEFTDGSPCAMNIPTVKRPEWIEDHRYLNDGLMSIERATFVSFLLPRQIVLEEGLPIKEFFIWADDTEYSKRISRDHRCFFVNNSVVIHKIKTNMGASEEDFLNETDKSRLNRYHYKFRNLYYVAREEGKNEVLRYWYHFAKLNIKCLRSKRYRFKKLRVLWKGYAEGIVFRPPIEKF